MRLCGWCINCSRSSIGWVHFPSSQFPNSRQRQLARSESSGTWRTSFSGTASPHARASRDVELEVLLHPGHAAELIVRIAHETQADLIVLGHKGHFLRDHLLGSTANRVAEHAKGPVMIVK